MTPEVVYLGHNNVIELILLADDEAVDLAAVTDMTLTLGDLLVTSDNTAGDPILWDQLGYDTGEIHLILGDVANLEAGSYNAPLVVYDAVNTDGIVWGYIRIEVRAEVEAP
jgi:hypothetical protein